MMQIKKTEAHCEDSNIRGSSLENDTEIEINHTINHIQMIEEPQNIKYIDLVKKISMPWMPIYEITILLIFKYFELIMFMNDVYFKSTLVSFGICLVFNLFISFNDVTLNIYNCLLILSSFLKFIVMSYSLSLNTQIFTKLFYSNDFLKIFVFRTGMFVVQNIILGLLLFFDVDSNFLAYIFVFLFVGKTFIQLIIISSCHLLVLFDLFYILMTLAVASIPYTIYIKKMDQQRKRRCKIAFYIYLISVLAVSSYNYPQNLLSEKVYLLVNPK
ncbi:hypothetical protein H312_01129 [Anncaliia algerae PRA339]|uniref:Uncharacterized protein n=1 Tax=Anncaliia algerae PRA339 TaxID=1288291 RepID=A0A059F2X8_9MICR|nr:hypothetical protein H312_01129 [Anncaliia algerae PRA339]